jgi:hypothetical protein
MSNSSAFGSLARKIIAFAIVAFVAIVLFKAVIAALAGIFQLFLTLGLIVVAIFAVAWVLRKL